MSFHKSLREIIRTHRIQNRQIFSIIISCFSGVVYGLSFAWTSPAIPKITQDKENYDITEKEASYFTIIPYIAMTLTVLPFAHLNDIIGRKNTILLMSIPCLLHWVIIIFAKSVYMFYLARLIVGVTEFLFISLPMYVGEISSPYIRGTWGNTLCFSINFGIFLINVLGSYYSIKVTAYICIVFCLAFISLFFFIPDTPYYYIIKNKNEKAKETLQWLYQENNVEERYKSLKDDVDRQMSETSTWLDLIKIQSNRKALTTALYLQMSIPFSGLTAFVGYSQNIFNKAGGRVSAQASSMIVSGIISLLCIFAGFTADKLGRKFSFTYSCLLCTIILLIETVYFWSDQYTSGIIEYFHWVPLTGMILFYIIHTIGISTVSLLMLEELFSTSIKTKGLCVCTFAFGITGAINNELFNVLSTNFGLYASYLFFTLSCFILFILSFRLVPETSGKTLEEIQQSFKTEHSMNIK